MRKIKRKSVVFLIFLFVFFIFGCSYALAVFNITIFPYRCAPLGMGCTALPSVSATNTTYGTTTVTLANFTPTRHCNISILDYIFKYYVGTSGSIGDNPSTNNYTAFICGACFKDNDTDYYLDGPSVFFDKINTNCSAGYYFPDHFLNLSIVDCNSSNRFIWANLTLGIDADNDNYTLTGSCQSRCVGNSIVKNGVNYYTSDSSANYIYRPCNAFDCNDSVASINSGMQEICNTLDDNCDGLKDFTNISGILVDVCGSNSNFSWLNLNGNLLTSADLNDTVLAYFGQDSIGRTMDYKIYYEDDILLDDLITSGTTLNGYALFKPIKSGEYYFEMSSNNWITKNASSNLNINNRISDSSPTVTIQLNVPQGHNLSIGGQYIVVFAVNEAVPFNKASSDVDDLLNLTWLFRDNNKLSFLDYSLFLNSSLGNTVHSYLIPNFYTITLKATEMEKERTNLASDSTSIYVLSNGLNVIPIINSPNETTLPSSDIHFSILSSAVLNCTNLPCPSCPIKDIAGKNCSYIHSPNTVITGNNYNLTVTWKIIDSQGNIYFNETGDWNKNSSQVVNFTKFFNSYKDYYAQVNVLYSSGLTRINATSLPVNFSTITGWQCQKTDSDALWVLGLNSINAMTNCTLHKADTGHSCCPLKENNICRDDNTCRGYAKYCSELNSNDCDRAGEDIIKNSITLAYGNDNICREVTQINSTCINYNDCGCFWNANLGKCSGGYNVLRRCDNNSVDYGYCTLETSVLDNCNSTENSISVSSIATLVNYTTITDPTLYEIYFGNCKNSDVTYACPSTVKLSFFGIFSLIVSIVLIFLIYVLLRYSLGKKSKKKKHL